jgi:hypothetical protein
MKRTRSDQEPVKSAVLPLGPRTRPEQSCLRREPGSISYFLNKLLKAARASLGVLGASDAALS